MLDTLFFTMLYIKGKDNMENRLPLTKIGEKEFDRLTFDSEILALVFFGVRRCKVCQQQIPIIENLAYEYKKKINTFWVDVDKYKPLFLRFKLHGVPNILIFSDGEVKERIRGLNSKELFIQIINKYGI